MATSVTPEQQAIIDRNKAAQEAFKAREAAAATRESVAWGKAASVAKAYLASAEAPIFLPFKDRDGQYVPCLVIGGKDDFLRAPNGDVLLDPKSRELMMASGCAQTMRAVAQEQAEHPDIPPLANRILAQLLKA